MATEPYITYNGVKSTDLGLRIVSMSSPPSPIRQYTYTTIPGRDGQLVVDEGCYEDIQIEVNLCFMANATTDTGTVNAWLTGTGTLVHSDHPTLHYKVKAVQQNTRYRDRTNGWKNYDRISVIFFCDPYRYAATQHIVPEFSGDSGSYTVENTHNAISLPKFTVSGSAPLSLIVNTNTIEINDTSAMIDCETRMVYVGNTSLANKTTLGGDWPYFKVGLNNIVWDNISSIDIVPRWRDL